jgi:hypothetical protein
MCAKSCNLTTSASKEGEFLHELEEKMEVGYDFSQDKIVVWGVILVYYCIADNVGKQ